MWQHKKHKGDWSGRYNRTEKGNERVFELVSFYKDSITPKKIITYESWQMAKRDGWKLVK